jgi:hypothetical protein
VTADTVLTVLVSVLAGVSLAAATGIRAFLPLLVVSVAARAGLVTLHEGVEFLAGDAALAALVVATLVEMAADKIPLVDHFLDMVAVVVRPGAAVLAGVALFADLPEPVSTGLAVLMGVIALGANLEKAKVRAGSTAMTAGIGNPFLSIFEDFVSGVLAVLAVLAPLLAAVVTLGLTVLLWRLVRRLRRPRLPGSLALPPEESP